MDKRQRKEITNQYTVVTAIASVIFLIASFFISSSSVDNVSGSFWGNIRYFVHQPLFWIILLLMIFMPLIVYYVTSRLTGKIYAMQEKINHEKDRMQQINQFTQDLIQEDFSVDLPLSGDNDTLGSSLINLRDTLKNNKDNELKRREEEGLRNWLAEGMAHFGEILRNHVNNLDELSFQVLKDLSKYINAVQGGFYMLDDADPKNKIFNLTAFYAYDRRKFADQQIKWGDGLIGTCALEKKTIHIKKVPESYIRITSGLGHTNPKNILLEPLLHENEVYGVLEFATLESFTDNHIKIVERIAGSIGSTLATIKNNIHTSKLLEESKAQAELLASQEEEMRQNMEELKATQEEAARQTQHYHTLENLINQTLISAEFNTEGVLVHANKFFLHKFQHKSVSEIEGNHIFDFVHENEQVNFKKIWNDVIQKDHHFEGKIEYTTRLGKELWAHTSLTGIKEEESGTIDKIILLAVDISEEQQQNQKLELIVEAIESIGVKMEMDIHGTILTGNHNFIKFAGITSKDFNSVTIFDLIVPIELESFMKDWETIIKGTDHESTLKIKSRKGEERWVQGIFKGLNDVQHQLDRIIFTGSDTTSEKLTEIEYRNLIDNYKNQEKQLNDTKREVSQKVREVKAEVANQYKEISQTNKRNEALLENVSDAIIITRSDNRIAFFNKAAENLWGYDKSNVLNQNVGMLFSDTLIEKDDFLSRYTGPGDYKITGTRKKVSIIDSRGTEKQVVFLLSKAKINQENIYLAIVQHTEL